jgi:PEGA domain-containing protein
MRYRIITLIAVFLMGLLIIPQLSEAAKTVVVPSQHSGSGGHPSGSHSGSGKTVVPYPPNYHGGYHGGGHYGGGHYYGGYYGHYYGHYAWPYWGWGGYYPYYGFGFYSGYPYYGGYPYYYGYPYYSGSAYYGYPVGSVRTEIKPQSAQMFVDGGYVGKADDYDGWWQRLDLEAGPHRLVFRSPGFHPYVVDIRVAPGQDIHLKYEMAAGNDAIDEKDMMLPRSEYENRGYRRQYPPDHRDDQYQRRPPGNQGEYEPMPGENEPPENDPGYYGDDQGQYQDRDQRTLVLHVEPSDATVYVDGNYYGTANDGGRSEIQVLLPPGNHRIEVVRPGYEGFSQNVLVSKDQDNHVNVILRKK